VIGFSLSPIEVAGIFAIIAGAAFVHGALGFGFPLIVTPTVAMLTDVKTAVLLTLLPNLAINVVIVVQRKDWSGMSRYWPVALWVGAGAVMGTQILLHADADGLKLLLAAMILVFLVQDRLSGRGWRWILQYPAGSGVVFGFLGGVLAGATNVTIPPLLIYFMALGLAPAVMIQVLNLCAIAGKLTQVAQLSVLGLFSTTTLLAILPLAGTAFLALLPGLRLQSRIDVRTYGRAIRMFLAAMVLGLLLQVVLGRL
jgi:uncharacterized membrane protein YfcA